MNCMRVHGIERVNAQRFQYSYSIEGEWAKYFELQNPMWAEYPEPVEDVPDSIAVLPLIGDVIVLASLMDADIYVDEIDQDFYECVEEFIRGYESIMPKHVHFKSRDLIHAKRIVPNPLRPEEKKGNLLFFSGGIDATSSLISHLEEKPTLVTIWGADVPWNQEDAWKRVQAMNQEVADRHGLELAIIHTNLRKALCDDQIDTYSYKLVREWWWPAFHHSVAMMCLAAPLACGRRENLYFGSTYSSKDSKDWGSYVLASDPAIDNHVRFCGCQVVHDGYEFSRFDKCRNICSYYDGQEKKPFLRVCYLSNTGTNCGKCEKCVRTIMAIKLAGYEPRDYGFQYNEEDLPQSLASGFQSIVKAGISGRYDAMSLYTDIQAAYREKYTLDEVPPVLRLFYDAKLEHLADFLYSSPRSEHQEQASDQNDVQPAPVAEEKQDQSAMDELTRELASANEEKRLLKEQMMLMENTLSWRITKPIRWVRLILGKLRQPGAVRAKIKQLMFDKGREIINRKYPAGSWRNDYSRWRLWFVCSEQYETLIKPMMTRLLREYNGKGCSKGWRTRLDYWLCWIFLGAEPEEYFDFEFFRKGWSWRNHHVTRQRLNFIDPIFNQEEKRTYIEDKTQFYIRWKDYLKRRWCVPQEVTFEEFRSLFEGLSRILVKPATSFGGHGIYAVDIDAENLESVYERLHASEEKIVAEEYVNQKGFLHEVSPTSLNPLRVTTVRVGDDIDVRYSFFTTSSQGNIIANDCSGGISFPVNIQTGQLGVGQGFSSNNHRVHPDTGVEVAGQYVPDWERIKEFACNAHRNAPEGLNLIGWDICWSDGEISLIEGNNSPSFPEIPDKKEDQWKAMQGYLDRMDQLKG